ncbi:hypothetical protein [Sphingomonas sp. RS2018]
MAPFEYAIGLISILMSLALADLVIGVHKILRHRRTVRWDGRILAATALVILEVIRIWFAQWTIRDATTVLIFPVYVYLFGHVLLLVLTALACLPDEVGDNCDLSAFYDQNRRYFWGAFTATQAAYFAGWFIFGGTQASSTGPIGPLDWIRMLAPLAAFGALIFVRWRWLDYAVPLAAIAFYAWLYWPQTLGG